MPAVAVSEATVVSNELVAAFAALIPQLSPSSPPPGREELEEMVHSPATVVLIARLAVDGETTGDIVGSLTLVLFRTATGVRAWIEDVVVEEAARGRGVGEALSVAALDRARVAGARTVDLTSRPSREAANRLYQRLGFVRRDTNVYRYGASSD
jgi:ribosomal protein S18 acetylase RimI-like enzyme